MPPILRILRSKIHSAYYELKFGIKTTGRYAPNVRGEDSTYYSTISYSTIFKILNRLELKSSDIFVDLGCGAGRVLCCASQYNLCYVIGVEIDKTLSNIAMHNAAKMRNKKSEIIITNEPAEEFDYRKGSVFYLFNPFGEKTLKVVLRRLNERLATHPRGIRIVYVKPVHEATLDETEWLIRRETWIFNMRVDPEVVLYCSKETEYE